MHNFFYFTVEIFEKVFDKKYIVLGMIKSIALHSNTSWRH
jgi:hypothetical protein